MPKSIPDRERIITYASQVSESELLEAIGTLQAIHRGRFPKDQKRAARGRKAGRKQATPELVQPSLTDAVIDSDATEVEQPTRTRRGKAPEDKFQPDPAMLKNIEESKREQAAAASGD